MSYKWSAELYVSETKPRTPTSPTTPTTPWTPTRDHNQEKNQASEVFHNLQVERQLFQTRLYTKWLNSKLLHAPGQPQVKDLFTDLRDGRNLLLLTRVLTGRLLKPVKGNLRLHHLNNLTLAFDVLREHKVKLIGLNNDSIADGETTTTLGLCWNIMYHFQVVETMENFSGNAEEALLKWCAAVIDGYPDASVTSFKPKNWKEGYTLNALLHAFKPELFRYSDLKNMNDVDRLAHALRHAEESFDVHALFTAEEFHNGSVDSKALVLYIGSFYEKMKDMEMPGLIKSSEEINGLTSRLGECEKELNSLNSKEAPELYVVAENEVAMGNQHQAIMDALDKVEAQLSKIMQEMNEAPELSEADKAPLHEKLSSLAKLHADIKEKWDACKGSFMTKLGAMRDKENSIRNRLQDCENSLYSLDKLEVPELYLLQENKVVMETKHQEVTSELSNVEDKLSEIMENLSPLGHSPFQEKLTELVQLHADIKEKWDTCKNSFMVKLDQQHAKELLLLNKWKTKAKSIDETLISLEGKLMVFQSEPVNKNNAQTLLAEIQAFEEEVKASDPLLETNLDFGGTLLRSGKIVDGQEKENLENEIDVFLQRKAKMGDVTAAEKAKLEKIVYELKQNSDNEEIKDWKVKVATVRKTLNGYEVSGQTRLNNPNSDLNTSIAEQKKLIEEASKYGTEVDVVLKNGEHLMRSISSQEKNAELRKEIESLNTLTSSTVESLEDILKRLQMSYDDQLAKELTLLSKWQEKADSLNTWLDDMELYLNNLHLTENEDDDDKDKDLSTTREGFELYQRKLHNESIGMQSNIDFGSSLIRSGKISNQNNKSKLQTELNDFSLRKDQLSKHLLAGQARLVAAEEQYSLNQSKLLHLWFTKANEIKKQLRAIESKGQLANGQTKEELTAIVNQLQASLSNLRDLKPIVSGHVDEGNGLLQTTGNKVKAEELSEEIQALLAFYGSVVNLMESNHQRFERRLIEVQGEEDHLITQWNQKKQYVDEELCQIEQQLDQFNACPDDAVENEAMLEQALNDMNDVFSSDVANKEGEMEISVGFGRSLLHSDRITNEKSKQDVGKDIESYASRKNQINLRIKRRKYELQSALEKERKRKAALLTSWTTQSVELKKKLRELEKEGEFSNVEESKEQLQHVIDKLKDLISTVTDLQPSIDSHVAEGKQRHASLASGSKADELSEEVSALEHTPLLVVTCLENSLKRFVRRLNEMQGEEEHLMNQWLEKRDQVDVSLSQMEEQMEQFGEVPLEMKLLEAALEEHEIFAANVANKEGEMEISVGFGRSLLHSDRITNEKSKQDVGKDIESYASRKNQINLRIKTRKSELVTAVNAQKKDEVDRLNTWLNQTVVLKTNMRSVQANSRVVANSSSVEELQALILKQQSLIKKAEDIKPSIDQHSSEGERLTATLTNPSKVEDVKGENDSMLVQYNSLLESLKNTLTSYESLLETMERESEDSSNNLLIRLQLFHDWILFARQQLQFVGGDQGERSFSDLLQKEQGLKKLSLDMETRGNEFDQFMAMLQTLEEGKKHKKNLSTGDQKALEKIRIVSDEWNFVIDSVDQEFKKIYDAINSMVDEKRGRINKTLMLLNKQLETVDDVSINEEKFANESILNAAKTISHVTNELSKVKPLISKLSQQTDALGDVTLFMEDEKTVMKKTSEELQLQYVECRDQVAAMKNKMQQGVVNHVRAQCEKLSSQTRLIEEGSQPFDSVDLTSLSAVKHFLHHEQKVVEDIKVEHFKIDDIESFAEQISGYSVLSPDDQVTLANIINESLKIVEEAQKKSKVKINKVYAVCYHTLNQNYQKLVSRLSEVEKESTELDDSVIQDFVHLKNDIVAMKEFRETLSAIKKDEEQVHHDVDSIKDVLDPSDDRKLENLQNNFANTYNQSDEQLKKARQRLISKAGAISEKKLDEFLGWYPIMKKRSEEGSELGPDAMAIERQLQECKVIEQQANHHSFNLLFNDQDGEDLLKEMDPNQQSEIRSAHADWLPIKEWLTKRKGELENARNIWGEFLSNSADLVDYMNHAERESNTWNELDLNDDESMEDQKQLLKKLLSRMETRKPHTTKLNDLLNQLLDLIGGESHVATKIRSQVADIFAMWNRLIVRNIENSTKLNRVHNKFKQLQQSIDELRKWINSTVEILRVLLSDDESIEESMKKVELKRIEFEENKKKLNFILDTNDELLSDTDTSGHFTINDDVQLLDRDFWGVKTELDHLDGLFSKAHLLVRRIRCSVRRKFDEIKSPKEENRADSTESRVENDIDSKMDIQLQDNGKDKVVEDGERLSPRHSVAH